jgi:hypothetical protein
MDNLLNNAKFEEASERFHEHLDTCTRCATSPFDLCETGRRLLTATASAEVFPEDKAAPGSTFEPGVILVGKRGPAFNAGVDMGHGPDRCAIRCVCLREFDSMAAFNAHISSNHGQITRPMLEQYKGLSLTAGGPGGGKRARSFSDGPPESAPGLEDHLLGQGRR